MRPPLPDPNAFASGADVAVVEGRIAVHMQAVAAAEIAARNANAAHKAAKAKLDEFQRQYQRATQMHDKLSRAYRNSCSTFEDARQTLRKAQDQVPLLRAPFNPIRRTPFEVLGLIFEYCNEGIDPLDSFSSETSRLRQIQPFLLARVCRRWRHAALASPRIWRYMELSMDNLTGALVKSRRRYLAEVVAHSGSVGLCLRICRTGEPKAMHRELIAAIVRDMYPRCTSLYIIVNVNHAKSDPALRLFTSPTPALREVFFSGSISLTGRKARLFPDSPSLGRVVTDHHSLEDPWNLSTVQDFVLRLSDWKDICSFVSAAPHASKLTVVPSRFRTDSNARNKHSKAVTTVSCLVIHHDRHSEELTDTMCRGAFPNLKELQIHSSAYPRSPERSVRYLAAMLRCGVPLLESLVVSSLNQACFPSLIQALVACSSLRRLEIQDTIIGNRALESFYQGLGRPDTSQKKWVCPNLTQILLGSCSLTSKGNHELLTRLVESRTLDTGTDGFDGPRASKLRVVETPLNTSPAVTARINSALEFTERLRIALSISNLIV